MTPEPVKARSADGQETLMRDDFAHSSRATVDTFDGGPMYDGLNGERLARQKFTGLLRLLWNNRRIVLRLSVYGLALSTAAAFLIPARYESTTRLMPPDQSGTGAAMLAAAATSQAGGSLGSSLGGVASDILGLKSSGALFIGILQSRTVIDDVITRFNLRKVYWDRTWRAAREDLARNTEISEDRKSGIITIQVTDKSPQRAAGIGREYVEELNLVVTQLNTSSAHREKEFLEGRLVEVRQDLESAEKSFSEFASKNTAIDIQAQGKAMIESAATLEGDLIGAQSQLQSMKQIYTAENVRVRATQARVDELRQQLQKLGGKYDAPADATGPGNQPIYPSIRQLPILGVSYADLYRKTKVEEAIYETLTREYELAKVEEAKETPTVKVIDPADVPERKSFPPRLEIVMFGTFLAVFASFVWIFAEQVWQTTDPEDPQKVLALEIYHVTIAHLPWAFQNGEGAGSSGKRFWNRLHQGQPNRKL